jgi:hypothetical protein
MHDRAVDSVGREARYGRRLAVSAWACQGLTGADLISLVPAFIWRLSMAPKMSRSCVATALPKVDNYQL